MAVSGVAAGSQQSDADSAVPAEHAGTIEGDPTVIEVSSSESMTGDPLSVGCRDHFGGTISQGGIEIGIEGYFGCCEAKLTVSILNATSTTRFQDCNKICKGESYYAGAIESDWEACYYNDEKKIVLTLHTKVWKITGWVEDTDTYVFT